MVAEQKVGRLTVLRPLLGASRIKLREFLCGRSQAWREDASNASDEYARNRIRKWLAEFPEAHDVLISLGASCRRYALWVRANAPLLRDTFATREVAALPRVLARESSRRWLIAQGASSAELTAQVLDRFVAMSQDAATPGRQQFPGNLAVRRRGGRVGVNDTGQKP
jgi:tRNA(Ile)-lysidine synthase TilS/MesJ